MLEHTKQSKVFGQKNPWLISILSILNSIRNKPGLRQNIKFEIEQLFNELGIKDINKYSSSNFLDNKIPNKKSQDFNISQVNFNNTNNNMNNNNLNTSGNYPNSNYENINMTSTGSSHEFKE